MFFKKKEKNAIPSNIPRYLEEYLNRVDEEYMRAFAVKTTKGLNGYISRDCSVKLSQSIFYYESRYFGADRFRETVWLILEENKEELLVSKQVVFGKVKVGGSMEIGIADDYNEHWVVDVSSKRNPVVTSIKRL